MFPISYRLACIEKDIARRGFPSSVSLTTRPTSATRACAFVRVAALTQASPGRSSTAQAASPCRPPSHWTLVGMGCGLFSLENTVLWIDSRVVEVCGLPAPPTHPSCLDLHGSRVCEASQQGQASCACSQQPRASPPYPLSPLLMHKSPIFMVTPPSLRH